MLARICTFFRKKKILIQDAREDDAETVFLKEPRKYMLCEFTKAEAIDVLRQLDAATTFPCTVYMPRITKLEEVDNMSLLLEGVRTNEYPELYNDIKADDTEMFVLNPITGGYEFNGQSGLNKFANLIDKAIKEGKK